MKPKSIKGLSIIGIALTCLSAVITAMDASLADAENLSGPPGNGMGIPSSLGGIAFGETVTLAPFGSRSWTQTGIPGAGFDMLSATSVDNFFETATNEFGVGLQTSDGTTPLRFEDFLH